MYKIVQVNNCHSRISRNGAKADRYKTRFFDAKFRDERAKARSEVLTKRFLRINSRAGSIMERIEASCFRKIPNKWLKEDAETRHFSHLSGIFRKQDASILSIILSSIDPALEFILKKRLVSTSLLALARSSRNLASKNPSFIAIGFGAIAAYSTVAVVGLD